MTTPVRPSSGGSQLLARRAPERRKPSRRPPRRAPRRRGRPPRGPRLRASRRLGVVLAVLAVTGVLAAGAAAVWRSSWLELRTIQVAGNHHVTTRQVIAAAALSPGVRLSSVSGPRVAARVEVLPWVASATVTHILPSRVRIVVRERTPAVVVAAGARTYLVDAEGVVLQVGGSGYPLVTGLPLAVSFPGDRITAPGFAAALKVLASLPPVVRSALATVDAPAPDRLGVTLVDHTSIVYGDAGNLGDKNYAVAALLADGHGYTSIDVRAPSRPAAQPR